MIDDGQLTFCIEAWREEREVAWCAANIRQHYPHCRVVVISDGSPHAGKLSEIAASVDAEFVDGAHLYPIENGGAFLHRRLQAFVERPTDFLVKIDPDAKLHRRFTWMPTSECLFGTPTVSTAGETTAQGGCYGLTGRLASELCKRRAFLEDSLTDAGSTWGRANHIQQEINAGGGICEDWICGYVVAQAGYPLVPHPEIGSSWRTAPPNPPPYRYAVTHPHREECRGDAIK